MDPLPAGRGLFGLAKVEKKKGGNRMGRPSSELGRGGLLCGNRKQEENGSKVKNCEKGAQVIGGPLEPRG